MAAPRVLIVWPLRSVRVMAAFSHEVTDYVSGADSDFHLSRRSEHLPDHAQPVAAVDLLDVGRGEAAREQALAELGHVGSGDDLLRDLLAAEAAVEVRADGDVVGAAGQVADVLDVG